MKFIVDGDINPVCTPEDLEVLAHATDENKNRAENSTISFFRGFLKRYDVDTIFTDYEEEIPDPDPRNASLVMFVVDYFLYILYGAQPDRLIPDIRVKRYEDAVKWLQDVQKGIISPDLPTVDTDDETDINSSFKWGGNERVSSIW